MANDSRETHTSSLDSSSLSKSRMNISAVHMFTDPLGRLNVAMLFKKLGEFEGGSPSSTAIPPSNKARLSSPKSKRKCQRRLQICIGRRY